MEKDRKGLISKMIRAVKEGDKVIWIVVVLLIMFSIVAIFSSTSLLAIKEKVSRVDYFFGQLKLALGGMALILLLTAIPNLGFFRVISRWGFFVSFLLLLMLDCKVRIGSFIHAVTFNDATRAISIGGFCLQVYEVVKIAMVMYLSWAVQTYEKGNFKLAESLSKKYPKVFGRLSEDKTRRWVFIFLPIAIVTVMILPGSSGSAFLTGVVMLVTIIIGGIKGKDLIGPALAGLIGILLVCGVHIISNGTVLSRMETAFNRLGIELPYPDPAARAEQSEKIAVKKIDPSQLKEKSKEFNDYLDDIRQPEAAEIAFVQGGRRILGKGPGKSTQKYVVPVMFEDYMFSFIIEEYGLIVSFIIVMMYLSLFARGAIIVYSCNNRFAKACIGGLVFLITFQALFHILINCNVGLLTGQTLPLISHGRCSFLCFCIAFGVILSISRMANNKIAKQQEQMRKLMEKDETKVRMDILDGIDDQLDKIQDGITEEEKNAIREINGL